MSSSVEFKKKKVKFFFSVCVEGSGREMQSPSDSPNAIELVKKAEKRHHQHNRHENFMSEVEEPSRCFVELASWRACEE